RWQGAFRDSGIGGGIGDGGAETVGQALAPSLMTHVVSGLDRLTRPGRERQIALILAEALEPSGWIGTPLAALALAAGASLPETEAVLMRLQKIEPTGLFARSLAECLRLQAIEAGCCDAVMACILDHLDLLAAGEFSRLARMCAVTEADIRARLGAIRGFDPKPGAQFDHCAAPVREPDLMAVRGAGGWQVTLNRSALPAIVLHAPAVRPATPDARAQWAAARSLDRLVQMRNATVLRVGAEILRSQTAALDQGLAALVPLTMAEVAQRLDLHESTISRIVAGTAVDTPRGTWWLRNLFSARLGPEGAAVSAAALRAELARMIGAEDPDRPISDAALAGALAAQGMAVARRTVAKYREMLHIPPAHRRRNVLAGSAAPGRDKALSPSGGDNNPAMSGSDNPAMSGSDKTGRARG
ncbi:MAG: RNA polymerase sigma-54 factor, partial [Paracoccaceae bacterium]|nr:RNA polymerase sigma-54 factor [Paracoccaceae bacterium]